VGAIGAPMKTTGTGITLSWLGESAPFASGKERVIYLKRPIFGEIGGDFYSFL